MFFCLVIFAVQRCLLADFDSSNHALFKSRRFLQIQKPTSNLKEAFPSPAFASIFPTRGRSPSDHLTIHPTLIQRYTTPIPYIQYGQRLFRTQRLQVLGLNTKSFGCCSGGSVLAGYSCVGPAGTARYWRVGFLYTLGYE